MASKPQFKAQEFIDAIPGTGGIITKIAAKVGCSWHTAKKYIDNYATVQQAYDDECEKVLDMAESVVIKKLTEEDEQTAKWYLGMKGGDRGYAPRKRIEQSGELNIKGYTTLATPDQWDDDDESQANSDV